MYIPNGYYRVKRGRIKTGDMLIQRHVEKDSTEEGIEIDATSFEVYRQQKRPPKRKNCCEKSKIKHGIRVCLLDGKPCKGDSNCDKTNLNQNLEEI